MEKVIPADVAAVIDLVAAERNVWVRLVAVKTPSGWVVQVLEVVTGEAPPSWGPVLWRYDDTVLLAVKRKGSVVGGWLTAGRLTISSIRMTLPAFASAQHQRRASQQVTQFEQLRWPIDE